MKSTLPESEFAAEQVHSAHYLSSIARFGDTQPVHASRDIYSTQGIKLLSHGARIDSTIYEHLLHHKLVPMLDTCMATEGALTIRDVIDSADYLLGFDLRLQRMQATLPGPGTLTHIMGKIPLNPAMAFKLSVMRQQRDELFQHSIFIALVSIYIGIKSGLSQRQLIKLGTAALLHDIGILHINPAFLDRGHQMTDQERRHLYAHPLIAWMILREYREFDDDVTNAVLQHHERLDGSGYPQGLVSDEIGEFGQIIAVAEIVASRYLKDQSGIDGLRLETMLKLNSKRYGRKLVGLLSVFYDDAADIPPATEKALQAIRQQLFAISAVLSGWEAIEEQTPSGQLNQFIRSRITALKIDLLDAGLNPYAFEKNMLGMEDNPRAFAEANILLEEAIWQLHSILREIKRRWPQAAIAKIDGSPDLIAEWMDDAEKLIG